MLYCVCDIRIPYPLCYRKRNWSIILPSVFQVLPVLLLEVYASMAVIVTHCLSLRYYYKASFGHILGILLHSSKTNTSKLKKRVKDSKPFAWIIRLSVSVGPSVGPSVCTYWRHELYLELVLKKKWFLIPAVFIGSFSPFGKLGIFTLSLKRTFIGWKYNIWFWWRFSKIVREQFGGIKPARTV